VEVRSDHCSSSSIYNNSKNYRRLSWSRSATELNEFPEDDWEFTKEFESAIQQSEREMGLV
jgi:hypothetical protein